MSKEDVTITDAVFTKQGDIEATFGGIVMTVPINPANKHYAEILRQGIKPLAAPA